MMEDEEQVELEPADQKVRLGGEWKIPQQQQEKEEEGGTPHVLRELLYLHQQTNKQEITRLY